jgi:GntR family transcriptional repressor for pyruvate dehydrogenase complex
MASPETSSPTAAGGAGQDRLYQELARKFIRELASGRYAVGDRLPAERELSAEFNVSRPTVREAMIALEVQGLVEVRVGSGAYVKRLPGNDDAPGFNVTAFELTEARLLFEAEAAALAATQITDAEVEGLEQLVLQIADENQLPSGTEQADRAFHLSIARATRNAAVYNVIEELWRLRGTSPESALLHAKARSANIKPVVDEHSAVLAALRARDPEAARAAMRTHLSAVLDSLLFATEERAIAEARKAAESKRARYSRATGG